MIKLVPQEKRHSVKLVATDKGDEKLLKEIFDVIEKSLPAPRIEAILMRQVGAGFTDLLLEEI